MEPLREDRRLPSIGPQFWGTAAIQLTDGSCGNGGNPGCRYGGDCVQWSTHWNQAELSKGNNGRWKDKGSLQRHKPKKRRWNWTFFWVRRSTHIILFFCLSIQLSWFSARSSGSEGFPSRCNLTGSQMNESAYYWIIQPPKWENCKNTTLQSENRPKLPKYITWIQCQEVWRWQMAALLPHMSLLFEAMRKILFLLVFARCLWVFLVLRQYLQPLRGLA